MSVDSDAFSCTQCGLIEEHISRNGLCTSCYEGITAMDDIVDVDASQVELSQMIYSVSDSAFRTDYGIFI